MLKITTAMAIGTALAVIGSNAIAASIAIDTTNVSNGLTDIYSATFDGALSPCGGGSPSYCSFFGGDAPANRAITSSPNPSGVINAVPLGITPTPASGSYLDLTLSNGNTSLAIAGGTIAFSNLTLNINSQAGSAVIGASGAGMVFSATEQTTAVNGDGQAEFLVSLSPNTAVDFSTLSSVVTSCTGTLCALLGVLNLDMVRYRLFIDFDPTFTSFTGSFIGQTGNNSLVYATLDSAAIPVPAAGWFLLPVIGAVAARARRRRPT